jgi:hypothetical protein
LAHNHLTASDPELIAWLNSRNPNWEKTQTPCPPKIQFSSATYSVVENAGHVTITVSRTTDSDGAVSVEYATSDVSPPNVGTIAPDDYTQTTGTLNWADGDAADKTFSVSITDDSQQGDDETFIVSLDNPTGGAELGELYTAVVTIMDDDSAFSCKKVTAISKKECKTLIALYDSTDGENWTDNTGWNVTNSPCNWYGVSCQGGRLTGLALGDNNLKGSIPKELSKLKKLESLLLNDNELSGEIPKYLIKLRKLTKLDLNDNCLKVEVSKKLGKWLNKLNPGWDETQTDCLY